MDDEERARYLPATKRSAPTDQGEATAERRDSVVTALLRELDAVDPHGLEPGRVNGAPRDEYAAEAAPIASILLRRGRITGEELDAVRRFWFSEPLSDLLGDGFAPLLARLDRLAPPPAGE
ncbi:hypothetical protein [Rathayibacter sp. VKM Ac-2801]|uniref:hypothetical protein n=1 Tax=Rathayibacter sp. VKM Ac-2801 TaxID=2609255 RepID=UPI00131FFE61|nr:hypothetical protein [Rathayibacter sp. VKM Ac-2801]QHC69698.1 hypothetical protein GSU45_04430 [Rathayibacter sp. VKM Ac-2801]